MAGEYTFRDQVRDRSPSWLQLGLNQKILYSLTVIVDTLGDALVQGIKSRYPGLVDSSTLGLIGSERRIRRGVNESDEVYAERLTHYWQAHRTRGSGYSLLEQVGLRYSYAFPAELLYRNTRRYTLDTSGAITWDDVPTWNPDPYPERWARWWLFCYTDIITDPDDVADLVALCREWNAAHCQGTIVIIGSGGALIDYHSPHLIDEPDTVDTPNPATYLQVQV